MPHVLLYILFAQTQKKQTIVVGKVRRRRQSGNIIMQSFHEFQMYTYGVFRGLLPIDSLVQFCCS